MCSPVRCSIGVSIHRDVSLNDDLLTLLLVLVLLFRLLVIVVSSLIVASHIVGRLASDDDLVDDTENCKATEGSAICPNTTGSWKDPLRPNQMHNKTCSAARRAQKV